MLPRGGKPNRPRDDDDDDDDDEDEDDRPARRGKKKKAASGSAMPLILGVVGVLVLAGGGVGAYFMFKKDAPATASNSSGGGTTPDGGPKGGPARGMAPPGGTAEPPAGWKRHTGNGFVVDIPDWQTKQENMSLPIPGKGTLSISFLRAERPDKKGGVAVVSQSLPPEDRALDPREYIRKSLAEAKSATAFGPLGAKDVTVLKKEEATVDGHPGLVFEIEQDGKLISARGAVAHGRLVMAIVGADKGLSTPEREQFLASLKITAPNSDPGQQVATNTPTPPRADRPAGPASPARAIPGSPPAAPRRWAARPPA